jgi:DNA invertase Pin-like site-specific DNA recombinase
VSTAEQALGPAAQRATIESWASRAGVIIAAWHEDHGVSGGRRPDERPGLTRALLALREHRAGILVVAKRDRLARDVAIALAIERAVAKGGARIVSADGTANGTEPGDEFMRIVIDGAAQYERALIRARTRAALRVKREQGLRAGCVPFGFAADEEGRLRICLREQEVIAFVTQLRSEGHSLREIVRECRGRVRSRAGTALQLTQVVRILKAAANLASVSEDRGGR